MSHYKPTSINIELTTRCPLCCPQCYCSMDDAYDIEPGIAIKRIQQAAACGVKTVALSGGETLCYPYLERVIEAAHRYCGYAAIATSGYRLTDRKIESLRRSGIDAIHISLNGSSKEINDFSRSGYEIAVAALKTLRDAQYPNIVLNWVAQRNNIGDFPDLVRLAEQYTVRSIHILSFKPNRHGELTEAPSSGQIAELATFMRTYQGPIRITSESCFEQLVRLVSADTQDEEVYPKENLRCRAGRYTLCVNVDGSLSPCRHLFFPESWDTIDDYWRNSRILTRLREQAASGSINHTPCHVMSRLNTLDT